MSSTRFCRVPLARTIALGLFAAGAAGLGAQPARAQLADPQGVRLCGAEAKTSEYQALALYETAAGLALLDVPLGELVDELSGYAAKSGGVACAKATPANLAVSFPGQPPALLEGPVSMGLPASTASLSLMDPAICSSYAGTGTGMTLAVTDTNNQLLSLPGWSSLRYDLGTRRFEPSPLAGLRGPLVQCHSFPWTELLLHPPQYGAPGEDFSIFGGSFENRGDLLVEMIDPETGNRTGSLDVTQGVGFSYRLRVTNIGESAVNNVRIREFLPQATLTPTVDGGSWTCTGSAGGCPAASGTGVINMTVPALARDQSLTFEITRSLPGALPGAHSLVAAAAFVDPSHATGGGEKNPADNAQPLVLSVVANQAPSVACTVSTVNLQEDAAPMAASCTATDADGDAVTEMTLVNAAGGTGFAPLNDVVLARDGSTNTWNFTIQPQENLSGTVTLHVRATDELTATTASPTAITVNVAAVNDAPTFTTYATTIVLSPTGAVPTDGDGLSLDDGSAHLVSRTSDCGNAGADGCSISISNFFENIFSGAANEAQTMTGANPLACTTQSGTAVSTAFYTRPGAGPVSGAASDLSWVYSKATTAGTTITCNATFTDSGGAVSAVSTITFIMGPLPPP